MDEYNNYENGYNQNPPPPRRLSTIYPCSGTNLEDMT